MQPATVVKQFRVAASAFLIASPQMQQMPAGPSSDGSLTGTFDDLPVECEQQLGRELLAFWPVGSPGAAQLDVHK